jgi:hypothetical protein
MGSNKNQSSGYGANPGQSGGDPRGRLQNQSQYQQQRYESQQGPMVNAFAQNYGQGSAQNIGDYTDIMNNYRAIATGAGTEGYGGGGGGYGAGGYTPFTVSYDDPFNSYGGFQDFASTGGYSGADMANLRARGVSPIRAAYANAQRGIDTQRSLQGGYSPNAIAARVKMAREQGQSAADAVQNVEGGIVNQRNANKLSGLGGMSGIEGQRLGAQIDVGKYNADAMARAQAQNIGAGQAGAAASAAAARAAMGDRLDALHGMTSLYGTTPGMSQLFGSQLLQGVGQGGDFGMNLYGRDIASQQLPGQFDTTMSRIGDVAGMAGTGLSAFLDYQRRNNQGGGGATPTQTPPNIPYHSDDPYFGGSPTPTQTPPNIPDPYNYNYAGGW